MSRYGHQDGANNEHYNIDLQSPFTADTLGDYGVTSVTKVLLEACAGNSCTNKGRIIPKARMVLAWLFFQRHLERETCSKDPVAIINASEYKRQL